MRTSLAIAALSLATASSLASCSGDPGVGDDDAGGPARRGIAESCTASEDCISTLCIDVGGGHSVCTEACRGDVDCPGGGWACVQPDHFDATVCGCVSTGHEVCGNHVDDDCNGRVDDCRMCGGFPVPEDDPTNCGSCGHVCRADQECHAAACRCADASSLECNGACVDVSSSTANCGSCGHACAGNQVCTSGTCGCPTGTSLCGSTCVQVLTDTLNCGSCGHACPTGQPCDGGTCRCPGGGTYCGDACTDIRSDAQNCGSCGHACTDIQTCVNDACTCPNGWTLCNGICIDTSTSTTSCGSCGHACRFDESCSAGICTCPSGRIECNGACIDTRADALNCGACGAPCEPGETCSASSCHCASGLHCGGYCMAVNDPANCGACGTMCAAAQICSAETCRCPTSSQTYCAGSDACVSLQTDRMNCGSCGNVCDPSTTCTAGRCVCPTTGQTFCAGVGCVSLTTDAMHCGACTTACAPNQTCSTSTCRCPGTLPNLCPGIGCVAEATDPMNCGACGNTCRSSEVCSSYACHCPLSSQRWCASASTCIDVYSDPMNCGNCGNVCPSDATCSTGTCRCTTAGLSVCGTSCVDLQTDAMHCGSCTHACTGSQVCAARACTCAPPLLAPVTRLTTALNDSFDSELAWSGNVGLVVWRDLRANPSRIYAVRVGSDGTALGPEVPISPAGIQAYSPSVVWSGTEFGVAWSTSQLNFVRVAEDGTVLGSVVTLPSRNSRGTSFSANRVELVHTATLGYVAVYDGAFNLSLLSLGADGSAPGLPTDVTTAGTPGTVQPFSVAVAPTGEIGLFIDTLQVVNPDGSVTAPSVSPARQTNSLMGQAALIHDGTTWVVAFTESGGNVYLVVDRGPALASRQIILTTVASTTDYFDWPAWVSRSPGELVLLWRARTDFTTGWRLDGWRFAPGPAAGPLTALDATAVTYMPSLTTYNERFGAVATSSGFALSWGDTRWGATEAYDLFVTLPACAM